MHEYTKKNCCYLVLTAVPMLPNIDYSYTTYVWLLPAAIRTNIQPQGFALIVTAPHRNTDALTRNIYLMRISTFYPNNLSFCAVTKSCYGVEILEDLRNASRPVLDRWRKEEVNISRGISTPTDPVAKSHS